MRIVAVVPLVAAFMLGLNSAAAPPDQKAVRLWKSKCAACHGADGKADTDQGKKEGVVSMATKQWQQASKRPTSMARWTRTISLQSSWMRWCR